MKRRAALLAGPVVCGLAIVVPPPATMAPEAWRVAGVAAWMAVWWLTAVIPLEATALLPIVLLPMMDVSSVREVTASYADPIIFLFLGGFLLAATLERWDHHKRFALATIRVAGTGGPQVVLAFMVASAALSMWISNTATAVMMLPIAKAVAAGRDADPSRGDHHGSAGFPVALMLAVAYGCSIGGVSTLIGTPPNALLAGAASELLGVQIGFGGWMVIGLGVAVPMMMLCWLILVRVFRVRGRVPGLADAVEQQSKHLPALAWADRFILAVFAATAITWILRAPKTIGGVRVPGLADLIPGISDAGIAIGAALVLFVVPLPRSRHPTALDWSSAQRIPWGILLLFGGGLALAGAFAESGLTQWIGGQLEALHGAPVLIVTATTATLFVFMTELTSNTATAALGMPLMAGVAQGLGIAALPLMATAALSASMAFMLPVATPPNAIVFGSGVIRPVEMAKAGIWLNLVAIVIITLGVSWWG